MIFNEFLMNLLILKKKLINLQIPEKKKDSLVAIKLTNRQIYNELIII